MIPHTGSGFTKWYIYLLMGLKLYVSRHLHIIPLINKSSLEFVRTDKDTVLAKDSHTDFVNKSSQEFVRTYNDGGKTETVPLTTGPDGFAIAVLKNETVTTEMPNLVLLPAAATKPKKPRKDKDAAEKSMKKPAAAKTSMKKQRKKQQVVLCIHRWQKTCSS